MRLLILVLSVCVMCLALLNCSHYKKHFGGHSGDYQQAESTKPLVYSDGADSLKPSARYTVPSTNSAGNGNDKTAVTTINQSPAIGSATATATEAEQLRYILPPDYRDAS